MSNQKRHAIRFMFTIFMIIGSSVLCKAQAYEQQIDSLAEEIAVKVTKFNLKNVAVLDFTDLQGNTQELGRLLAQELITSLVMKERLFKTIDRLNLKSILQEQKLSMTGLQSSSEAKKLKISGVDGLIRGTITRLDEGLRINLQIITVENGTIVGGARGTVARTNDTESLGSSLGSSSSYLDGNRPETSQTRPSKEFVAQDKDVRATLKFFRKASGGLLTAIFLVENLKGSNFLVSWNELQAIDDLGNQWRFHKENGIFSYPYVTLAPGAPITAVTVFHPDGKSVSGTTKFNIIGSILIQAGNEKTLLHISFSDVSLGI